MNVYLVLLILVASIAIIDPRFLSIRPLRTSPAVGNTSDYRFRIFFIILTGGVDLSAGRMVVCAGFPPPSCSRDALRQILPRPASFLCIAHSRTITICFIAGIANSVIVARFGVPPFIATLGMQVAIYGINSIYFDCRLTTHSPSED